jgi:putative hydrolase of the HAD superfamily
MIRKLNRPDGFDHVEAWIFDLDNTLYPADCNLFAEIDQRMGAFIAERFNMKIDAAQRLRKTYYYQYGTTLAGLMRLHDVCPDSFLDYVHDIDLSVVESSPELREALNSLPGRKFIFTNGSRKHAEAITGKLGIAGCFEEIFDIHAADFIPKPDVVTYESFIRSHGVTPQTAAMFDDLPQNLKPAHGLGMTTVLVASGATEHPEHQALQGWRQLPEHIHHATDALPPFLAEIGMRLQDEVESSPEIPLDAQFCLT